MYSTNVADIEESSAVMRCNSVTITCTLKPGSNNQGCHVIIVSTDKLMPPHNILRVINGSNIVEEDIAISGNEEIIDVLVFDLYDDSTVGNVTACLGLSFINNCTSTSEPITPPG